MSNDVMTVTMTDQRIKDLSEHIRMRISPQQQVHLDQLELRIRDQRERFTQGLLEVGRCLNEAKDAEIVPHGYWVDWVAANTGLNIRSAQRLMRAAREIPKTSALSLLDFSKVSALLALPAEEREEFARDADAEHATLRQLEQAIREKKEAEQRAEAAEREMRDAKLRAKIERDDKDRVLRRANELGAMLDNARNNPTVVEREVVPADYEAMKARDLAAADRIREAEDYAEAQEERVRELQAKLDAARNDGGQADDVQRFIAACSAFYGEVCRYQNMDDAQLLRGKSRADLESMRTWVSMITAWANAMGVRLSVPVTMEADGYVR